jgi:serine protease Do
MRYKIFIFLLAGLVGINMLAVASFFHRNSNHAVIAENLSLDDQEATIRAISKVMPAVVSINVQADVNINSIGLDTGEEKIFRQKQKIGAGTGFLISADGLIITNKHVVNTDGAKDLEYRIALANGKKYYAQLIGKDPIYDLAILKIFDKNLPFVEIGDSDQAVVGTTVIAIGNALGIYDNTATKGIISGLGRNIIASDQSSGFSEVLDNVIQTDAQINQGNSGGPLVDLAGKVIGINSALDEAGLSIGFAIPINDARQAINSVKTSGRIIRSKLGLRYQMLTLDFAQENNLPRISGAYVVAGKNGEPAIAENSPADRAGLLAGDIIFEVNAIKIEGRNTLLSVLQKYKPKDKIGLKVQRGNAILTIIAELEEFK